MAFTFTPYYPGGWQSGEEGGTPITPAALNHYDDALEDVADDSMFHVGDIYRFDGAQVPFRTLADKSALYFCIHMPKELGDDVTSFNVAFTTPGNTWFSNGSAGSIPTNATIGNKSIQGVSTVRFSTTTSATPLANTGFGLAELYGTVTFT